jgi:hypothetical protein
MKRAGTFIICLATMSVGIWVMFASNTLSSACTLGAPSAGPGSCVSGLPFRLVGGALIATGAACTFAVLFTWIRGIRRNATQRELSAISTLHQQGDESLRDVA